MFLDTSSMVNLTCIISWTISSPNTVTWYHNHTKLTIRGPRTGVSILVDKSEVTTVSLILQTASQADSGLYECEPDNAPRASMFIHVLRGESALSSTIPLIVILSTNKKILVKILLSTTHNIIIHNSQYYHPPLTIILLSATHNIIIHHSQYHHPPLTILLSTTHNIIIHHS